MVQAKRFQCPFCSFNITARGEDELLRQVMEHMANRHPKANIDEDDIRSMIKTIEVEAPRQSH